MSERVSHTLVRDVQLPDDAGILALLTVDNGLDHTKPTTLGLQGLTELRTALLTVQSRAAAGEIAAVAVTGKPYIFVAGADLTGVGGITEHAQAREIAELGHAAFRLLGEMGVPTFAFINGAALGGGLELALHCDYRTVSTDVRALGLPECSLGLVPGWGGCYLLPRLIGLQRALDVLITRPLNNNRLLDAGDAMDAGIADFLLDPADFLEQSIAWATHVLSGQIAVQRPPAEPAEVWQQVVDAARTDLQARVHESRLAPYMALDLAAHARDWDRDTAFAAEDAALSDLIMSDQLRAGLYSFELTTKLAKRPAGAPDADLARPVRRVGIVGAGLMAAQLAVLIARRLGVPVIMRDLDQDRVAHGLQAVRDMVERQAQSGRLTQDEAHRVIGAVTGTTELTDLAGTDLVIEAVTERLDLKKLVFAELEDVVEDSTVLATNTSALSVERMAADLRHPERVVGLHFFNPVAQMPLVEVVRAPHSSPEATATAFAVVKALKKTAVGVADRPGFVVNRLLILLLSEVLAAVENGTPVEVADTALRPLGLPMGPFALLQLVGTGVARHVLSSLHEDLGPRYRVSPGLDRLDEERRPLVLGEGRPDGTSQVDPGIQEVFVPASGAAPDGPLDGDGLLDAVLTALATEIGLMLKEEVVASVSEIDLCMILGAGWPFYIGGISPYLDRTGHSERVLGRRLLPRGQADVGA